MKVVFTFPGQGSQRVGMGQDFVLKSEDARSLFARAEAILGYDLAALCADGPSEALSQTEAAQPALYVTACGALVALQRNVAIGRPFAVAGHSVGEFAALYAAGAIDFEAGLDLVRRRAALMASAAAARPGQMAAILGLDAGVGELICAEVQGAGIVVVANDNGQGQFVLSGDPEAVERAGAIAKERGARRVIGLAVSGAFHSPLMAEAASEFSTMLEDAPIRDPHVPVVSNTTATYSRSRAEIISGLQSQMAGRVRWRETLDRLVGEQVDLYLELGSGDVLTGLLRRHSADARCINVSTMDDLERVKLEIGEARSGSLG